MKDRAKEWLVYAISLIAAVFCGKWATKIFSDFIDSWGSADWVDDKIMIPTNLLGAVELLVTVIVLALAVELIKKSNLIK